ncbi:2-hydroxymuconate tautomerase [Dasania marina]|uniref:2-hydroxymuconate tautomerase n=1 Tax=Dasania marina TaxID=471499 RepID=UPI00036A2B7C|nr:2-hydroxymuconate tautomerase [Dasania marina]
MPIAVINIIEGRTQQQKHALIHEITEAIVRAIDTPPENVRVIINDMPKDNFGIGGLSVTQLGR